MDDTSKVFLFLISALALIASTIIYLYKLWIKRKHTRERFVFTSLRVFSGFMISVISLLLVKNQVLEFLIQQYNRYVDPDLKYQPNGEILYYIFLILACSGLLLLLIVFLIRTWDGPVSTWQVNSVELGRRVNIWDDFIYYLNHRKEIEIYQEEDKSPPEVFSPYERDTRAWHIKAADLLNLFDHQYHISDKHWYGEHHCYIADYGQDGERIGIFCVKSPPSQEEVERFLSFTNTRTGKFHKYVIAINGEGQKKGSVINGCQIEYRFESELLDNLVPLSRYKEYIDDYFNENPLENSELKLVDMYVPLGGHTVKVEKGKLNHDKSITSIEQHILDWAKGQRGNSKEHLAVLGNYGQGKTVLMHKLVKEMLDHPDVYQRIPILIELRALSPRNEDELGILGQWANRFNAKSQALLELHKAGKLFIILDGFDEMDLVGDTELLFNHFSQLWALARVPNSKIIIAGRPNLFADDQERRMALGIQEMRTNLPYSKALYLDQLTTEQIEKILRNVKEKTQQEILTALKKAGEESSFTELIGRPSTLYQLSTVWDSKLAGQENRLNSAEVIESFLFKNYDRQESKASTFLTSNERHYFMMGIAVEMMLDNGYSNQVKSSKLDHWIKKLWKHFPPKLPPYRDAMEGYKTDFLPNRLETNIDPLGTIIKDVRVGGILVQDLSGRDVFKFSHKSYMEYLVSAFFSGSILQSENDRSLLMMAIAIAKSTAFTRSKLKASPDVDQFTVELIASQIEVLDQNGSPLPVASNESLYSKALYEKLIVAQHNFFSKVLSRYFPKLTAWLSFHPDQKYYLIITISSILFFIPYLFIKDLSPYIIIASIIPVLGWNMLVFRYRSKKSLLDDIQDVDFLFRTRLYLNTCEIIKSPFLKFKPKLGLILKHRKKEAAYQELTLRILAINIFVAGGVAAGVAYAYAFEYAFEYAYVITFAYVITYGRAYAGISTFKYAYTYAIAIAYAFAGAIAYADAFAIAIAGAFAFAGAAILNLYNSYKKALNDLTS